MKTNDCEIQNNIFFSVDNNGTLNAFAGNGLKLLNLNGTELIGKNIYNSSKNECPFLYNLKNALLNGINDVIINAEDFSFKVSFSYSQDMNGNITGIIGTAREISSELELQEEINIHKGFFSQLFESSPQSILITDSNDMVLNVNGSFERLFGFSLKEIKGSLLDKIVPLELRQETAKISQKVIFGEINDTETRRTRKDGMILDVHSLAYPLFLKNGHVGICWILSDITERKRSEKFIHESLVEKELLLKEIHHRVKNNLQIICSLFKIQSQYIIDKRSLEIFKESQNRIRSIGLIHEKLYQTRDLSRIDFEAYIRSLITQLFLTFGKEEDFEFCIEGNNIFLSVDCAIPCGLIINELVTNSLKYGYPEGKQGKISVIMTYDNEQYTLKVTDNGIGIPEGFDFKSNNSMGIQLINALANQLDAEFSFENINGAVYTMRFHNLEYNKRL